ncbi:Rv3235 family protein [Saxibacter everestensis]|uniref:Rv3235 family protein n=1 Tax=Saxibacter everestensis TaxID=2909229 RepID=A0ABY8QP05_9MICO|nr:Rv3235 family protein [Brevibacteriaceae bacterium ZFBP1038]
MSDTATNTPEQRPLRLVPLVVSPAAAFRTEAKVTATSAPGHAAGTPSTPPSGGGLMPEPTQAAEPVCKGFAVAIVEAIYGVRPVTQVARWLSADAYAALRRRAEITARARSGQAGAQLPRRFRAGTARLCSPCPQVVEASVVVFGPDRVRAVALRLESPRGRWIATAVVVG